MMVFRRWAMVMTIAPTSSLRIVCWIYTWLISEQEDERDLRAWSSKRVSIWEVASSMMIMFVLRITALASATSCFSPALNDPRLTYISRIVGSSALGVKWKAEAKWQRSRTSKHSCGVYWSKGSRLLLRVPGKIETSWLMIVWRSSNMNDRIGQSSVVLTTLVLRSSKPIFEMSIPSILLGS